jgi:hypothetical protein
MWISNALRRDPALRPSASELVTLLNAPTDVERQTLGQWAITWCPPVDAPLRAPYPTTAQWVQSIEASPPEQKRPVWFWSVLTLLFLGGVGTIIGLLSRGDAVDAKGSMQASGASLHPSGAVREEAKVPPVAELNSLPSAEAPPSPPKVAMEQPPTVAQPTTAERVRQRSKPEAAKPKKPANRKPSLASAAPPSRESRVVQNSAAPSVAVAPKTYLEIRVNPYGQVFLDGDLKGMTPLGSIEVRPGIHTVLVLPSGDNPQLKRKTVRVEAVERETTRVTVDLTAP